MCFEYDTLFRNMVEYRGNPSWIIGKLKRDELLEAINAQSEFKKSFPPAWARHDDTNRLLEGEWYADDLGNRIWISPVDIDLDTYEVYCYYPASPVVEDILGRQKE